MHRYDVKSNKLHEVAIVSLILGGVIGVSSVCLTLQVCAKYDQLLAYLLILSFYYFLEFFITSKYQSFRTTSKSFLIYGNQGNREFIFIQLVTIWEYLLRRSKLFAQATGYYYHRNYYLVILGLLFVLIGLTLRASAMTTCGNSFSHYIQTSGEDQSRLVTHGVYAWCRHPSYLGFYLLALGIQLFMENHAGPVLSMAVMSYFFTIRIQFEEWFLVHRLYGQTYSDYRKRVGVWIPFVKIKKDL